MQNPDIGPMGGLFLAFLAIVALGLVVAAFAL